MTPDDLFAEFIRLLRKAVKSESKLWSQQHLTAEELARIQDDFNELVAREVSRERSTTKTI